jgi:hypothetical protein
MASVPATVVALCEAFRTYFGGRRHRRQVHAFLAGAAQAEDQVVILE